MAKTVGVREAKTHLSHLLDDIGAGEEVLMTRRGEPVAQLVPVPRTARRTFGLDRHRLVVPEEFDAPLDIAVLDAFGGT